MTLVPVVGPPLVKRVRLFGHLVAGVDARVPEPDVVARPVPFIAVQNVADDVTGLVEERVVPSLVDRFGRQHDVIVVRVWVYALTVDGGLPQVLELASWERLAAHGVEVRRDGHRGAHEV